MCGIFPIAIISRPFPNNSSFSRCSLQFSLLMMIWLHQWYISAVGRCVGIYRVYVYEGVTEFIFCEKLLCVCVRNTKRAAHFISLRRMSRKNIGSHCNFSSPGFCLVPRLFPPAQSTSDICSNYYCHGNTRKKITIFIQSYKSRRYFSVVRF